MNNIYPKVRLYITLFFLALFAAVKTNATHIFGGELYYSNISGLQYQVTLVLYGDCSGASFPTLQGATPTIMVYNNTSFFQQMTLTQNGPGVEVTPVCPSQVNSTTCTNPTNTVPGIAYMARGGSHLEKNGKVVMAGEGAKVVKEPPHWMVMWPFDPAASHLPTVPNPSGVYIMFEGSPYAHLMIYQDPNRMK